MTDIFDVLSDETRRTILTLLLARSKSASPEVSVSQLVTETGQAQPSVSKQLKILREVGLVSVREDGQHRLYRLDSRPLASAAKWMENFTSIADGEPKTTAAPKSASAQSTNRNHALPRSRRAGSGSNVQFPDVVLDAARDLGAAAAELLSRAPWR